MRAKKRAGYPGVSTRQSPRGLVTGHTLTHVSYQPDSSANKQGANEVSMTSQPPTFTHLTCYELLALAAAVEFHACCGLDARAEMHQRLAELRERRWQRWVEEWSTDRRDTV